MTLAEILAALAKLSAEEQKEFFKQLTPEVKAASGLVIRTTEEDSQYVTSQVNLRANQVAEENFNRKYKERMDALDADILEATGVAKKAHQDNVPDEKTTDYLKRAIKEAEALGKTADAKMVRKLQNDLREAQQQRERDLAEKDKQLHTFKVDTVLDSEFNTRKVHLPAHLKTDDEKRAHEQLTRDSLKQQFKSKYEAKADDKGNIIFYLNGEPVTSKQNGQPLKAGEILDQEFRTFFAPVSNQQNGTGATPPNDGGTGSFKTTKEVHAHLASKGMDARKPEYQEEFNKLIKENKIEIGGVTLQ